METPSFIRREKSLSKYVDGLDPYETLKKRKKNRKRAFRFDPSHRAGERQRARRLGSA